MSCLEIPDRSGLGLPLVTPLKVLVHTSSKLVSENVFFFGSLLTSVWPGDVGRIGKACRGHIRITPVPIEAQTNKIGCWVSVDRFVSGSFMFHHPKTCFFWIPQIISISSICTLLLDERSKSTARAPPLWVRSTASNWRCASARELVVGGCIEADFAWPTCWKNKH